MSRKLTRDTDVCREKLKQLEMRAFHKLSLNSAHTPQKRPYLYERIYGLKKSADRIKGDLVNVDITDYRYYLIEPSIDTNLIYESTLFVFVQSKDSNGEKRKQIRETWANRQVYSDYHHNPIYVIFAIGLAPNVFISNKTDPILRDVIEEADKTKDILLLNMMDIYDNLTIKGFLTMLWIANRGFQSNYIMKTDDDIILNMFAWFQIVKKIQMNNIQCVLVGHIWTKPPVERHNKYKVDQSEYGYQTYPSFASGWGYVMTRRTMVTILEAALHLPFLIRDDPYFAGIIPHLTGIPLVSVEKSSYILFKSNISNKEMSKIGVLLVHVSKSSNYTSVWNMFLERRNYGRENTEGQHKDAVPVDLWSASDVSTQLPPEWRLPKNISLISSCNESPLNVTWRIMV